MTLAADEAALAGLCTHGLNRHHAAVHTLHVLDHLAHLAGHGPLLRLAHITAHLLLLPGAAVAAAAANTRALSEVGDVDGEGSGGGGSVAAVALSGVGAVATTHDDTLCNAVHHVGDGVDGVDSQQAAACMQQ